MVARKTKAPEAPEANGRALIGAAMLANVRIRTWSAHTFDRKITEEMIASRSNGGDAPAKAGKWVKNIFGEMPDELARINGAVTRLRMMHYAETLPWLDNGWRMLPSTNFFNHAKNTREIIAEIKEYRDAFLRRYPALIKKAEKLLRPMGMFDPENYPSVEYLRSRFTAELQYAPIPAGSDFRLDLPEKELERIRQTTDSLLDDAMQAAMAEAWQRLGKTIHKLRERLADGRYLREEMIRDVGEMVDSLGRMNVAQDKKLIDVCAQAKRELASLDVDTLRNDTAALQTADASAKDLLTQMRGLFTPEKKKEASK